MEQSLLLTVTEKPLELPESTTRLLPLVVTPKAARAGAALARPPRYLKLTIFTITGSPSKDSIKIIKKRREDLAKRMSSNVTRLENDSKKQKGNRVKFTTA